MPYLNQDNITTLDEKKIAPTVRMGLSTAFGTRKEQQDTVFAFGRDSRHIAAVCDGMGGLTGGDVASRTAVEILAKDFLEFELGDEEIPEFLNMEARRLDKAVFELTDEKGKPIETGTTIAAVFITGQKLYWMSVGDSKIYYITNNRIVSLTREHNYRLSLDIMRTQGTISEEDYEIESEKGEALISYLGMGDLSLIDGNEEPILLQKGDAVLLCSDGLYKSLNEANILGLLRRNRNVQTAANALTDSVMFQGRASQDNASAILIRYE